MSAQVDFAIVPTQEELDRIQREFRFQPSPVTSPKRLSPEQVEAYNRDGFVRRVRIFEPSEITDIRNYFDRLLEATLAAGGDAYSISTAHLKHGRVYDILTDRRIVECVCDLLGEDVIGWGSHFFCKLPGDGKQVSWHQDASYWPLSHTRTVTVWLAIDDADLENGCMQVLPGSHLCGHLEYEHSDPSEGNVLDQTVPDVERFGQPVPVELQAGEISLHSDLLLHGSEANRSSRRRCGLTLRYCTPDVRAHCHWHLKGVVVHGQDRHGNWANPPRPQAD